MGDEVVVVGVVVMDVVDMVHGRGGRGGGRRRWALVPFTLSQVVLYLVPLASSNGESLMREGENSTPRRRQSESTVEIGV